MPCIVMGDNGDLHCQGGEWYLALSVRRMVACIFREENNLCFYCRVLGLFDPHLWTRCCYLTRSNIKL